MIKIQTILIICIIFICSVVVQAKSTSEQRLQSLLDQYRSSSQAPAAVMSIGTNTQSIMNFTSGTVLKKTKTDPNPPRVTINNLFQIGSITKNFIAAVILQLEAEKKLSINETIAKTTKKYGLWLPKKALAAWKNITIKQLLNMTSGIYNYTEDPQFIKTLEKNPQRQWTPQELLKIAYEHKPLFAPGASYHYCDTNYIIIGLLIQAITQQSIQATLNQRLFKPLHLNNTFYIPHTYSQKIMKRMAHGYGTIAQAGEVPPPEQVGEDMTRFNLSMGGAAGAMISTAPDLVKWVQALFNGKILPPKQLQEMLTVVCVGDDGTCKPGTSLPPNSHSDGYGLGIASFFYAPYGSCWTYLGSTPGYYAAFLWIPKKKTALALTVSATTKKTRRIIPLLIKASGIVL